MAERLVVIGGDAGGMAAASQARRVQPYLEIVAFERGDFTSYSACGIPYLVSGDVSHHDKLIARTPQEFRDVHRIDVRIRHEVTSIDLDSRRVTVYDHGRDRSFDHGFDRLHIGTGARPVRPDIPGINLPMVHGVQTIGDGIALRAKAESLTCKHIVIVGGGYIGCEMAEAFIKWGAEVTLVEANDTVMRTLDPELGTKVAQAMRKMGVDVRTGVRVQGFEEGHVVTEVGSIHADLVVLGLGVTPNSELAAEAGIETGVRGAIKTNQRQQTSVHGVYAAGDCAESFHRVSKRQVHVALGTVANKQGRVAGTNLGGGYASFPGVVGTAITKVCDLEVARTGLNRSEADAAGFQYELVDIDSTTRAAYYPGAAPMTIRVLAELGSRRLLGAQIVGREDAAKRIDVFATALTAEMTVDEMVDLDLAYAPPFSGVWDAIHIGARKAVDALDAQVQANENPSTLRK